MTIHNRSHGLGIVIVQLVESAFWALWKASSRSSFHLMRSVEERPAIALSRGVNIDKQPEKTLARTLYAPINNLILRTFSGVAQEQKYDGGRGGVALSEPCNQIHPKT